jgi:hypothetical protein
MVYNNLIKIKIGYNILLGVMSSGFLLSTNQSVISILFKTEYSPKYMLVSSAVDRDLESFVVSPLSMQH